MATTKNYKDDPMSMPLLLKYEILHPERNIGDYLKAVYLSIFLTIGIPLNLTALIRSFRHSNESGIEGLRSQCRIESNRMRQQVHISSLLICIFYGVTDLGWLVTYAWEGGPMLCRWLMFLRLFSFHLTSNTCVAVSAFSCIKFSVTNPRIQRYNTHLLIGFSYAFALMASFPQLFLWTTVTPFPLSHPDWSQCVSVLDVDGGPPLALALSFDKTFYNIIHLCIIFWVPLILMIVFHVILLGKMSAYDVEYVQPFKEANAGRDQEGIRAGIGIGSCQADDGMELSTLFLASEASGRRGEGEGERGRDALSEERERGVNIVLRTIMKMTISFGICWFPYFIIQTIKVSDQAFYIRWDPYLDHFNSLIMLHAIINPLIYTTV